MYNWCFGNGRVRERGASVRGGTSHTRSVSDVVVGVSTSRRAVARLVLIPLPERGHVRSLSHLCLGILSLIMEIISERILEFMM